ncbi:MAG: lysophospholipid acyltransferase family protein [bacterium]|nr:lysophospholipid acyltransferase family protein [bacterium]
MRHPELVYTSPNRFTTKQRLVLATAPPLAASILKMIAATCRIEVRGRAVYDESVRAHGHCIAAIWHETLGLAASHHKNSSGHTLTSYSFDGELATRLIEQFGLHAVRGSSSRGGAEALEQLEKACGLTELVGFTLDGPRGPRRVAKPGIAVLAARTQLPVVPNAFAVTPSWRMNSWDRLALPKPFARILVAYGPPIPPPASDSPELVEPCRLRIETELSELQRSLEEELGIDPGLATEPRSGSGTD